MGLPKMSSHCLNIVYRVVWAHFDNRYWVMFSMAKSMGFFSSFKEKKTNSRNKKGLPFFDILTALCHSKLYFCIPNVKMCLLVNQIFDFLFYFIILYSVSFSQFVKMQKIPNSGGQVMFPK